MSLLWRIPNPRKAFVASWLFAAWLVVITALLQGSVPIGTVAGAYLGFGAGVEITLFIGGWRAGRNTRVPGNPVVEDQPPPALPSPEEQAELVDMLRGLDVPKREAVAIAGQVPGGFTREERVREAIRIYGEERR